MLATLIPLFDKTMKVRAYSLASQKNNYLLNPSYLGSGHNDGAGSVSGFEIINTIGIDTLSPGTEVFVPISHIAVFADIESQCTEHRNRIVLMFDNMISCTEQYINRLKELKEKGFHLALSRIPVASYDSYSEIFSLLDYYFLDEYDVDVEKAKIYFKHLYPDLMICVEGIEIQERFDSLKNVPGFALFEGSFYRLPVTKGIHKISPLKINYLQLLDIVNAPDFELSTAADIISRDPALVLSLLDVANRMSRNSKITSVRHATAMLGQRELKQWINIIVTKELCTDRPNEIMRLSLLRAKFAEQLAPLFHLAMKEQELFLMGLFSVLDIILQMPLDEALKKVNVSKEITDALVSGTGEFAPVQNFILHYINADWQEVSRQMILQNIDMDGAFEAYMRAMRWYRDLFAK